MAALRARAEFVGVTITTRAVYDRQFPELCAKVVSHVRLNPRELVEVRFRACPPEVSRARREVGAMRKSSLRVTFTIFVAGLLLASAGEPAVRAKGAASRRLGTVTGLV